MECFAIYGWTTTSRHNLTDILYAIYSLFTLHLIRRVVVRIPNANTTKTAYASR